MNVVAEFSERFSELIDGKNFTQVGNEIGMSKQTVSAYANGVRNPKKPTVQAIAAHYGVNPAWLIGYDAPKFLDNDKKKNEITFDDFTFAMQNETKDLTEMDKQILLSMAKQLNDARKQRDGET